VSSTIIFRVGVDVLAAVGMLYMLYLQVKKRYVTLRLKRPVILAAIGLIYFALYVNRHPIGLKGILLLVASTLLLGVGMGIVRAYTVRVWREGPIIYRQGRMLTVILWAVAVGLHITVDYIARAGSASLLVYLAVTFAVQRLVVWRRAFALQPTGAEPSEPDDNVQFELRQLSNA
jgi:hypothetical protein